MSAVLAGVVPAHLVFLRFLAHEAGGVTAAASFCWVETSWPQVLCPLETYHGRAQRRGLE